jgi:hypothetical protein
MAGAGVALAAIQELTRKLNGKDAEIQALKQSVGCISIYCNFSLAPGFSPVGAGDAAPSRFNGFALRVRKTVETVSIFSANDSPG